MHTGKLFGLHWDSRDQHHDGTAAKPQVRLPCHHHPQGPHQGNVAMPKQHTEGNVLAKQLPVLIGGTRLGIKYYWATNKTSPEAPRWQKVSQQAVKLKPTHRKWSLVSSARLHSVAISFSNQKNWTDRKPTGMADYRTLAPKENVSMERHQ